MLWFRKTSDADLIRHVEKFQLRLRRPMAILMMTFSATLAGGGVYLFHLIESGLIPLFDDEARQSAFRIGAALGLFGGLIIFWMTFSFVVALYWLFVRQKDQLLVSYYHRLRELGELEAQ